MIYSRGPTILIMPAGWDEKIKAKICPVCEKQNPQAFPKTSRLFLSWPRCCGPKCTAEFWKHAYPSSELRLRCLKRDNWTCRKCGIRNTYDEWLDRVVKWINENKVDPMFDEWGKTITPGGQYEQATGDKMPERLKFDADHIKPVALGGAQYDLENYQALCEKCHKEKTAREAKEFARARVNQLNLTEAFGSKDADAGS